MALISEKKFTINSVNGNGYSKTNNQHNYYSQTSLLSTRIEFKSAKEHSSEESSEEEDIAKHLKSKYNVLIPDASPEKIKNLYSNGSLIVKVAKKNVDHTQEAKKDGNELGEPKHTLFSREKINSNLDWKKANKIGSGLSNLGNTCFLNSVIQCLTYCPPLINYLNTVKDEHPAKCRLNFCMMCLMMKHVNQALSRASPVIKPYPICQRLKSIAKHFNLGRQEDAHEFLRYVIDHMWRSCLSIHEHDMGIAGTGSKFDHLTKSTTAINQIFGGYHRSQVLCMNCKEKSNTYDYFMDFMLDIQNVSSLTEALQKFVTPEILRNDNAYKCSKCKKSVVAKKQFTVYRAPNVATFQFKRFDCTRMFGKISKPVTYQEKLDLRPYMSDKGPPLMYKLASVLVHLGASSNSGHYYCFVRNSNNSWYQMDDSSVSQVGLNEVLNQKAYVLFYVRCPESAPMSKPMTPQLNAQQKLGVVRSESPQVGPTMSSTKIFNSNFKFSNCQNSDKSNGLANSNGKAPVSASSLRLNLSNARPFGQKQSVGPVLKKPAFLVPYDKDSDDDNESGDVPSSKANSLPSTSSRFNVSQPKSQPQTSNDTSLASSRASSLALTEDLNGPNVSGDSGNESGNDIESDKYLSKKKKPLKIRHESRSYNQELPSSRHSTASSSSRSSDSAKEPIPILKVKATTNSWHIVESTHSTPVCEPIKVQSNWRISQSSDSSKKNGSTFSKSPKEQYKAGKPEKVPKEKKDKGEKRKKKHKKDKNRQKRRDHENDSDDEPVKWVERTKETLEMETKSHQSNDQSEKRKIASDQETSIGDVNKKMKLSNGDNFKKTDILDAMLKGASYGYGDHVKSWDGGVSKLNRSISEDKKASVFDYEDEYNEEFDQGKMKKIKAPTDRIDLFKHNSIKGNPFQRAHHSKHMNGNGNPYESNFSRNSFHKTPNGSKSDFKSGGKFDRDGGGGGHYNERHFDKPKERSSFSMKNGGSGHQMHNHDHHRMNTSNNGHRPRNRFKHY